MAFDGSFTHAITKELNEKLKNSRISKISNPYDNELILTIRSNKKNVNLLLSANPNFARIQLSNYSFSNPLTPSNFVTTLRKKISGSFIKEIHQVDNDRIVHIHLNSRNEIGDEEELILIIEIMARHSNIILVNKKDNSIIDSIKRIGSDQNRYRLLLPGATYINPPKQNLINPFEITDFEPIINLNKKYPNENVLATNLNSYLQGLSYETSLALAKFIHKDLNVEKQVINFFDKFNNPTPTIFINEKEKLSFSPFYYYGDIKNNSYNDLSEMLDDYFEQKVKTERVKEKGSQIIKVVKNEISKNKKKIKKLEKTLEQSKNADIFRIKGEILTTYLGQVNPGMKSIKLPNFYDNLNDIEIKLDETLSPSSNAQKYFKLYQKNKNASKYVINQIDISNKELDYFENIKDQVEIANPKDLDDIKNELISQKYIKKNQKSKKINSKIKLNKPEEFTSSDGTKILVGKNNLQNDKLTLKFSDKREYWLHAQNIHGSHVIIKSFEPSEETLIEAATLASYFSKAKESANVPVDYVQVKKVKKPNGSKPGFVTYEGQQTLFVTPKKEIVNNLR
ncbi:DUF814 domain-containing protein [Lactobacillus sp. S2-2]|uniref:Rqc2 family fibronectin-binding protein n=1 Tax=Lactobacillus sp. S2-2 TaxID=2692917 RepID=UPI001F157A61|nr:NFACT RNA binding domain-containing protein [Lactobacillus sp. S2-2]MCF6515055.1 DUF814 domain-containing protein [Lactobacillus sp. S2-2]